MDAALCLATSPALGMAGELSGGRGASEAAGSGCPFIVVPMRMICWIGNALDLLHLLAHVG